MIKELTTAQAIEASKNYELRDEHGKIKRIRPYDDNHFLVFYKTRRGPKIPRVICLHQVDLYELS